MTTATNEAGIGWLQENWYLIGKEWPEMNLGLVKLVVMTDVFFNKQQHQIEIKRLISAEKIKSGFFSNSWNQHFCQGICKT